MMNEQEQQERNFTRWVAKHWKPYRKVFKEDLPPEIFEKEKVINNWIDEQRLQRQEFLDWKEKNNKA